MANLKVGLVIGLLITLLAVASQILGGLAWAG